MVLLQVRNGMVSPLGCVSIIFLAVVTARCAESGAGDVDVETKIQGFRTLMVLGAKMGFPDVNGSITRVAQNAGERDVASFESRPVPVGSPMGSRVVLTRIDPVGRAMASRRFALS